MQVNAMLRSIVSLFVLSLVFMPCPAHADTQVPFDVTVKVTDTNRNPVPDAHVFLDRRASLFFDLFTDDRDRW
jgi:hypothetical protein